MILILFLSNIADVPSISILDLMLLDITFTEQSLLFKKVFFQRHDQMIFF